MKDAASMAALDSMMGGMGAGGAPPMDPAAMEAPPTEEMPGGDIESGIAMIEGALTGAPPDKAEEIRSHLNALREISASMGTEAAPPEEEIPGEEMPPIEGGV